MPEVIKAILLGIVEGVTEFLPVSSTGHLLLLERWMGLERNPEFWKMFVVVIQIGAIAAVAVYFRERIMELLRGRPERKLTPLEISAHSQVLAAAGAGATSGGAGAPVTPARPSADALPAGGPAPVLTYSTTADEPPVTAAQRGHAILMIILASLPLAIAYFADEWAERHMTNPMIIAAALIVGGLLMILIEWLPLNTTTRRIEYMTWKQAVGIGFSQVVAALFPGTSRSAATIMGGLLGGLSRPAAAEFSFFLAIPAMGAACSYKLLKFLRNTSPKAHEILLLVIGTLISFLVAWVVIAGFMAYIRRHSFVPFAIYRILLGVVVLVALRNTPGPQVVEADPRPAVTAPAGVPTPGSQAAGAARVLP